jgi:hypothetical protein
MRSGACGDGGWRTWCVGHGRSLPLTRAPTRYDQRIKIEETSMIGGTILIVVATGFLATVLIAMLRDARQL